MVKWIGMDHYERQTLARNFVVNLHAIRFTVRHIYLRWFKSFNRFAPFKTFKSAREVILMALTT
jgi:hypothetical protein